MFGSIKTKVSSSFFRFNRDEEGSMVVFTLWLILMMLLMGGMAVDMMRFETYRARLQSTIDRAVLAAADLDVCQNPAINPEDVVRDYVAINGFEDQVGAVTVVQGLNSCTVTAEARIDVNTIFMQMVGIDQLGTPASSGATESINEIEVSLVLDVSGSMDRDGRIEALRPAAIEFVDTVLNVAEEDMVMISLVPYSTTVSVGPELMGQFTTQFNHDYSYCIDLPADLYNRTDIPTGRNFGQSAHFDANSTGADDNRLVPANASAWTCNPDPASYVLPFQTDLATMTTHINNLEPYEWTSIEMGAKWGVALLDDRSDTILDGLIADGVVDAALSGRPRDFGSGEALKVLVIMTDGENTRDYVMANNRRTQLSDIWLGRLDTSLTTPHFCVGYDYTDPACGFNPYESIYFVRDDEPGDRDGDGRANERHWLPNVESMFNDTWDPRFTPEVDASMDWEDQWRNARNGERQTWQDIWARWTVRSHAWNFRGDQTNSMAVWNAWYNDLVTVTFRDEKDRRLDLICDAAKAEGILIYTIGFQVTDRAADVMESCATGTTYFFRVNDLDIGTAFNSIANSIASLRLTQ